MSQFFIKCSRWALLLLIILITLSIVIAEEHGTSSGNETAEKREKRTRPAFCQEQKIFHSVKGSVRNCEKFNPYYLSFFFTLFIIFAWGAFVRTLLKWLQLSLPYTIVLMLTGLVMGIGAHLELGICKQWTVYTKIARMSPKIILNVFLPVLIFESAFNMNAHVFFRSISQILVLALPGMIIATFLTAFICMQFLTKYHWSFAEASLFGSIISATDPVAVVAILRELGTSEMLSTAIEGESLLNDGVAILLYEVFDKIVIDQAHGRGLPSNAGLSIFLQFLRITLGGPIFGYIMAKISVFCLSKIFNDATVEITITLVAAYLTYYISEGILGVSGVMAVVALGIIISANKTAISPEVENAVHHFWEMLGYLANTVLFVLVGIVIVETAISGAKQADAFYLLFLYLVLNVIRLGMLLILSPWLSRIGYGLTWQNMIVMMWGGLRGAVGICLALIVYKNKEICKHVNLGPKILIQTAGIVILTLVINGTTTKKLLDVLKVTQISIGRLQDMANAIKHMNEAQSRTIGILKDDQFLSDSRWDLVVKYTDIENPYRKKKAKKVKLLKSKKPKVSKDDNIIPFDENVPPPDENPPGERADVNSVAIKEDEEEDPSAFRNLNVEEFKEMTEEARIRLLKAMKSSYWRQYEHGILTAESVQILVHIAEATEDRPLAMIHVGDIKKYWRIRGLFPWVQMRLDSYFSSKNVIPPLPEQDWRKPLHYITTKNWFEGIFTFIVLLNLIPVIWEFVLDVNNQLTHEYKLPFLITNIVFTFLYVLEFAFKILGRGCKDYWTSKWNYIDFVVLIISLVDIGLSLFYIRADEHSKKGRESLVLKLVKVLRILRIVRSLKLLKPLLPRFNRYLTNRIHRQLFHGLDIAKGFVTAVEDALKFLPQMINNDKIYDKLKKIMEYERVEVNRAMGFLQQKYPGIAIAVKTRHASRAVLNQMRDSLFDLKEDGLVDEKESTLLLLSIEHKMKRLWNSPPMIEPSAPQILLSNVSWVLGNDDILTFLYNTAELRSFDTGDEICGIGDTPNGLFIIVSGMVKIHYEPTDRILRELSQGLTPVVEFYADLTFSTPRDDFFSTGAIIGEMCILTRRARAASVSCETPVDAFFIPQNVINEALDKFDDPYDSLEARLWKSCGSRLASAFIPTQPLYSGWNLEKIRLHLERSAIPIGEIFMELTIPPWITDIIVIYGRVRNASTGEIYTAPYLVPKNCVKLSLDRNSKIMVIASPEIDHEELTASSTQLHNVILASTTTSGDLNEARRRSIVILQKGSGKSKAPGKSRRAAKSRRPNPRI